jgi:hypothetical protein
MIAVLGALVPGAWLATVSGVALARRTAPPVLSAFGVATGAGLTGVLFGLQLLSYVPAASAITAAGAFLLIPSYLTWATWTGARLIRGRARQLA